MLPAQRDWRPGASRELLSLRADLMRQIRLFFYQREILEVETPGLVSSSASDVHLDSFALAGEASRYLHTSPEFAMKRLLAAGSGPIYQLCKCFRRGEAGPRHNPEFTMLEWYHPGFTLSELMDEVAELVTELLGVQHFQHCSYRSLFERQLGINPHQASAGELERIALERLDIQVGDMGGSDWLDLLMSHLIEPELEGAVFVYDFPNQQASLSQTLVTTDGDRVARRFELYIDGLEVANGYQELLDAGELQRRVAADNIQRREKGLPGMPLDPRLLAAHEHGLPPCAGVAVGVDRLLMLKSGADHIDQVLAFSYARA